VLGDPDIFTDPNLNYYPPNKIQGGSLIGFENDSRASVYSLSFNATPGDPTVAAFICNPPSPLVANAANLSIVNIPERPITPNSPPYYYYNICTAGVCPQPPYAYACDVVFSGGIPKSGTTYFSLSNIVSNYAGYFQVTSKSVIPWVTFQDPLPLGQTATATVTLYPSPSPLAVTLALAPTTGTGGAVFVSTNSTTMTVTQSGSVQIKGTAVSSTLDNIELSASVSGEKRSRVNFTVTGATLSCTNTVSRGSSITCQINNAPAPGSGYNWQFTDASKNVVTANNTSSTWSGAMVTGVTVSVSIGGTIPLTPATVTVNPRTGFAFTAANPTQVMSNSLTCYDGTQTTLPSPPGSGSAEGVSCADMAFSFSSTQVVDGGPNNGYQYVTSVSNVFGSQPTKFEYIVVSDLLDPTSAFYTAQCGTFSASNTSGFVAGSQLNQNVFDHEQGSILSHWTEYRDAQNNSSNNVGTVLEPITGPPGMSTATYQQNVSSAGQNAIAAIAQAFAVEPCNGLVSYDSSQSCKYCGNFNYAPYQSCGAATPVPYCQ
jgi:hypothetical protein